MTFAAVLGVSAPSRAETCGNMTERGACQDAKTLLFCKDGALQTLRCGVGEICSYDERFNGAAGCIATRYTGCGAVTELGLCAGDTLLYCANNTVEELACPEGTACAAQATADGVEYDCVTQGLGPTLPNVEPEPVEPGEDGTDIDEPSPIDTTKEMPGPSVEQGGAPAEDFAAAGAGCAGAEGSFWMSVLGFVAFVRAGANRRNR